MRVAGPGTPRYRASALAAAFLFGCREPYQPCDRGAQLGGTCHDGLASLAGLRAASGCLGGGALAAEAGHHRDGAAIIGDGPPAEQEAQVPAMPQRASAERYPKAHGHDCSDIVQFTQLFVSPGEQV